MGTWIRWTRWSEKLALRVLGVAGIAGYPLMSGWVGVELFGAPRWVHGVLTALTVATVAIMTVSMIRLMGITAEQHKARKGDKVD